MVFIKITSQAGLSDSEILSALTDYFNSRALKNILLIPPDYTRLHSGAGRITRLLKQAYEACSWSVMPALGTHEPMSRDECDAFFEGAVEHSELLVHNWRTGIEKIGEVPGEYVSEVSEGIFEESISVEINRELLNKKYDTIISVGQVVPHEVVGMANYSKNIFVGCGGSNMINASHMLGAFYGLERIMGEINTPVRRVFDYAQEKYLSALPVVYILTVTTADADGVKIHGLYIGTSREIYEQAAEQSKEYNMVFLEKRPKKVVVFLDGSEFKSTWLGNKAIYRTRKAIADKGELIVLAAGVARFGEDAENDRLIRKYGYCGRKRILELIKTEQELKDNLSVAAHLIHGSGDGRFSITYAVEKLSKREIEGVGFGWLDYNDAVKKYNPVLLKDGWQTIDGEEIYYISNPALGLWDYKEN